MNTFIRLLSYSLRYKRQFFLGVVVSFFVAFLNGLSLTAFIPLFEALGNKNEFFEIPISRSDRQVLRKTVDAMHGCPSVPDKFRMEKKPVVPPAPESIDRALSLELLNYTHFPEPCGLSAVDFTKLRTVVRWKLRINAGGHNPLNVVYLACLIVLPFYLIKLFFFLVSVRLIAGTGYRAVRDIRSELYSNSQRLPLTYFYREKTGLLMSRLINDAEVVAAVISSNLRDAVTNFFYIITHFFLLAYLNFHLLLISVFLVPLMLSPVTMFTRKIRKATTRGQELLADLNAHVHETISGVRVIRAFGMEDYEISRFSDINQKLFQRMFKQQFYVKVGPYLVEFFSVIVTVGIIAVGSFLMDPADFSGGEFIAFLIVLLFIIRPIIQLSGMYSKIIQGNASSRRIFEILDRPPDVKEAESPIPRTPLKKEIEFRNLNFIYPETERTVLNNFNLKVAAGSTVALVGESGGGKSTLMDLLARFFDPTEGGIFIDGADIRTNRILDHRSRIGIVTQDIFLFHGTIRENISCGAGNYSYQEIENAARFAHAHDFIVQLPAAYNTVIGERGFTLSGGERQRIAIARALLRNPEILILDEATSALDTESERLVQRALEHLFKNRTTFVIAHRLSTIENADNIVVISEGRLEDMGTHQELMQRDGLYARLQQISQQSVPAPSN